MRNYSKEIEQFITDYKDGNVAISDGVFYSMREVNENSLRLYNGQFKSGNKEDDGFMCSFVRKAWVVYRTLIQNSDLDLKNLNARSINGVKYRFAPFIKMAFISYLSRTFFGEFMDKVLSEMCWFGSSIVKRADGTVETVDLRNYITEPNIQDPQQRRHLEMCPYSYDKMLSYRKDWKENWDAIERVWQEMQKENESQFKIIEFWTFNEEGKKICVKALDNTITKKDSYNSPDEWTPYITLDVFETPLYKIRESKRMAKKLGEKEYMFPYAQFDLFKVFGRQQGLGCGELLYDVSITYNTIFNSTTKNIQKAQMGVHIHNAVLGVNGLSKLLQENISNLLSGGVISLSPGESLDNLKVETRLAEFDLIEKKLYEIMRQLIGITAQGTGEEVPASTSATQASINQQTANTVYDFVRERMHHGMKRLFNNGFSEDIWAEIDEEELTAIIGTPAELVELDKILIDKAMEDWALAYKENSGMYPAQEEYDAVYENLKQELISQGDTRFAEIKKKITKDMKYMFEFEMTQEGFDYKARYEALAGMKNDPNSTKSKEKIEDEILTLQGLNPMNYAKSKEELEKEALIAQQELMAKQPAQAPSPLTA